MKKSIKTSDIINMDINDFNKMNKEQLKQVVSKLSSTANKRLKRMEQSNKLTSAYDSVMESGGKFGVKGKNLNSLRVEFIRVKAFLTDPHGALKKTETTVGTKRTLKATKQLLQEQGVKAQESTLDKIFRAYERLKKTDKSITEKQLKYQVLVEISKLTENQDISVDEIYDNLVDKLDIIYQENQSINGAVDDNGISRLLSIGENL